MTNYAETQQLRTRLAAPVDQGAIEILNTQQDARKIPISRSRHVRGWHPVRLGHPPIAFESKLEARLITALAQLPELISIRSQPITVHYQHNGIRGRYTPDFYVELARVPMELTGLGFGLRTYVEVKPYVHALGSEAKLKRQFDALRAACNQPVVLVTSWDLVSHIQGVRHVE